jgi:hypothetical protein
LRTPEKFVRQRTHKNPFLSRVLVRFRTLWRSPNQINSLLDAPQSAPTV